jgi:endonuclease/exonuclease/phosphatase family metal-dependent hydrolase
VKEKLILVFILLFTIQSFGNPSSSSSSITNITTANIAWYGSTKFPPMNDDEREGLLKDFFLKDLITTDIFLFQEITKPEQFQNLLDSKYKCLAYDDRGRAHQYVVTCFDTAKFEAINTSGDLFDPSRALLISERKDRLRDVLFITLKSKTTGQIINTYNLHLKSGTDAEAKRRDQSSRLLSQIKNQNIPLDETIVIGGDFNSYTKKVNNIPRNEIEDFLLEGEKDGLEFFTQKDKPTTLSFKQKTFDFLLINTKHKIENYLIHPICNKENISKSELANLMFFKDNISDHCPVTTTLIL